MIAKCHRVVHCSILEDDRTALPGQRQEHVDVHRNKHSNRADSVVGDSDADVEFQQEEQDRDGRLQSPTGNDQERWSREGLFGGLGYRSTQVPIGEEKTVTHLHQL